MAEQRRLHRCWRLPQPHTGHPPTQTSETELTTANARRRTLGGARCGSGDNDAGHGGGIDGNDGYSSGNDNCGHTQRQRPSSNPTQAQPARRLCLSRASRRPQHTALQAQEGALCSYCASKLPTWTTPAPPRPMTCQAPRHQTAWRPTAVSGRRNKQATQAASSDAVVVRCCLTCGSVSVGRHESFSSRSSSRDRKPQCLKYKKETRTYPREPWHYSSRIIQCFK